MSELMHVVRYSGPFGFIKPWTAVRDVEVYSQHFLTPSIVEGMQEKLSVSRILRHRLIYGGMALQQEQTQPRGWKETTIRKKPERVIRYTRERAVITRGVLLNPVLHLAFASSGEAALAAEQHVCLCRNEDVLLPDERILTLDAVRFDALGGFELLFGESEGAILVGYNRFDLDNTGSPRPMYGRLHIVGDPIQTGERD